MAVAVQTELDTFREAALGWEAYRARNHFANLDGLRCLSILAVIWQHGPGTVRTGLAGRGYLGVPLFFAISGFLITTLLLREQARRGGISLSKFYARRSLRIFPLYYAMLGVYVAFTPYVSTPDAAQEFWRNLPYFATYTSNWFVGTAGTFAFTWSLATEEQFYAMWPAAVRWLKPFRAVALAVCVLVAILVARAVTDWFDGTPESFPITVFTSIQMAILWGCIAAYALHTRRGFEFLWSVLRFRAATVMFALAALAALAWMQRPQVAVHFLFAAIVVASAVREDNWAAPFLQNRLVQHIGRISYGAYLMHSIAYGLVRVIYGSSNDAFAFFWAVIFTVLIASISYWTFEGFFLRKKQQFSA